MEQEQSSTPAPARFPIEAYKAAIAQERDSRDYVFLGQPHAIQGVEIRHLTLRDVVFRLAIDCPVLNGKPVPTPEEVAAFLWFLAHGPKTPLARYHFVQKIAGLPYGDLVIGIREFIDFTFLDAPGSTEGASSVPRASIAATLVDIFAHAYGWARNDILNTPIAQLYQLLREIQQRANPNTPVGNRKSDKIMATYMRELNNPQPATDPVAEGDPGQASRL